MNDTYIILICFLSLWIAPTISESSNFKNITRVKREPPIYRPPKQTYGPPPRRKPKPVYGPPPRPIYGPPSKPKPVYGPPKPVYGPPKPIYGPPKPVYGPPKPIYGPPPKPIYNIPIPSYETPSYNQPASGYGPPPSTNFHQNYGSPSYSAPEPPSSSYGVPMKYSPPSDNYGPPIQQYKPPTQSYQLPPSQSYGAPVSTSYGAPPSSTYGAPFSGYESQTTSYSHSSPNYGFPEQTYSSYDIPQDLNTHPLSYDSSSASYGTPGAVNSYGVPITQHEPPINYQNSYSPHQRNEDVSATEEIYMHSFSDPYNADSTSNFVKFEDNKSSKLEAPDSTFSYENVETTSKVPNHNYDGPGVDDKQLEIYVSDKKKQQQKFNNYYKNLENINNLQVENFQSFDYYRGKDQRLSEKRIPFTGRFRPHYYDYNR